MTSRYSLMHLPRYLMQKTTKNADLAGEIANTGKSPLHILYDYGKCFDETHAQGKFSGSLIGQWNFRSSQLLIWLLVGLLKLQINPEFVDKTTQKACLINLQAIFCPPRRSLTFSRGLFAFSSGKFVNNLYSDASDAMRVPLKKPKIPAVKFAPRKSILSPKNTFTPEIF